VTGLVWGVEWRIALRRRRLLALNVAIPLLLVLPVALGPAPPPHAAAVYVVLFILFGTFGAAIPLVRDARSGLLARIRGAGIAPASILLERSAASSLLDLCQLLPSAVAIWAASDASGFDGLPPLFALLGALALSLTAANLVGLWIGVLARSLAEAALFAAVAGLLLLHASGVFRTPAPGSLGAHLEAVAPFRLLHEILLQGLASSLHASHSPGLGPLAAAVFLGGLTTALGAGRALRATGATP